MDYINYTSLSRTRRLLWNRKTAALAFDVNDGTAP